MYDFGKLLVIIISAVFLVSAQKITETVSTSRNEIDLNKDSIMTVQKEYLGGPSSIATNLHEISDVVNNSTFKNISEYLPSSISIIGNENASTEPSNYYTVIFTQNITSEESITSQANGHEGQILINISQLATEDAYSTTTANKSSGVDNQRVDEVDNCPDLSTMENLDSLTQDEFMNELTDGCRYDRLVKPETEKPVIVYMQIDMNHVESADHLQLKAHVMVQLLYKDLRLNYTRLSPGRGIIQGEEALTSQIWVPHIVVDNERESSLMGLSNKDVFVQILPNGYVIYSYRMTTTFYCWMNLQKFPFDSQICSIKWVSWAYNTTNLELRWEPNTPYTVSRNLHLTEYLLEGTWNATAIIPARFQTGGLAGNYSAIIFYFKLRREVGYYIMDYFLPSILLVCMSWVTFWLQADASAPRAILGGSTMLSFITLNGALSKNLPKVSYIKASEIWFIGCASFIFLSLAEFAFVNVIWRRKKGVEMKKQDTKHILKGALTPSLARKQLGKSESCNTLYKAKSCSSIESMENSKNTQMTYLAVDNSLNIPKITTEDEFNNDSDTTINIAEVSLRPPMPSPSTWTIMTPQEIAIWIDRKARIVFPVSFLIFNIFYWSFVYVL